MASRKGQFLFLPACCAGDKGGGAQEARRALSREMYAAVGRLASVPAGVARTRDMGRAPAVSVMGLL